MGTRLAGKVAVVVGGGQTPGATVGNGRATAVVFAREGAEVLVVDRHADRAESTVDEIRSEGGRAEALAADIATDDGPGAVVGGATDRWGRIDVLHNNVGIGAGDGPPHRVDEDAFDRILAVNLRALWRVCKHAVPVMRAQGGGAIVNVSSLAAVAAAGNLTAYKLSKAGVNALTQNLAVTNARHGVRANAIMPGFIDTPMAVDDPARALGMDRDELAGARAAHVPMGRQGTAWDVAHAALFLASDEAGFVTGVVLPVDGGQGAMIG